MYRAKSSTPTTKTCAAQNAIRHPLDPQMWPKSQVILLHSPRLSSRPGDPMHSPLWSCCLEKQCKIQTSNLGYWNSPFKSLNVCLEIFIGLSGFYHPTIEGGKQFSLRNAKNGKNYKSKHKIIMFFFPSTLPNE